MEFLKVLLIIVAFYYAFKFGIRLLMPFLMKKMAERLIKKAQQQAQYRSSGNEQGGFFYYQNFGGQQEQQKTQNDGKVKVDYIPPKEEERKGPSTAGEFIDFEEVK